MSKFQHILVATDFGESSMRAVDFGLMLATQLGARITLVHAYEIPPLAYEAFVYPTADVIDALINAARAQLDKALTAVRRTAPDANAILRQGVPWQQILSAIDEAHADLVVVGTHGRGGLPRFLLGSVAERVVRLSPMPVVVVR
jgi:nucleotide-binding universal stress UspA family protein